MSLSNYVPTSFEVNQCIKPEAEGSHEAVLLAVHQPTPLSYQPVSSREKVTTDENALLAHIVSENVPTGALVVPVTGASGAGKSHLIRVIDARLRNSTEGKKHLIIRIPKSASLRRVVELILEPLPSKYTAVKAAFNNALTEVNIESAAIRIQSELEIALGELTSELRDKAKHNRTQTLLEQLDHAERLPLLLRDPVTSIHFRRSVFPRIVHRAVAGSGTEEVDPTAGQFSAGDLDLPDSIELGQAAKPVANYYRVALQARHGHGKTVAADVLNAVVDQATRQLFSLHDAIGGMTLQEVILEIRQQLLHEGRDLVLLVEDFAALTGIQETLAKVLIQEGVRDGVTQYCTMRSVIAVTDGYLVGRDTLATRAMGQWIVESKIHSEDEIFSRTNALVAAYLNAARWGQDKLIRHYSTRTSTGTESKDWLPVYRVDGDQEQEHLLEAFGFEQGIPLFPFTGVAVECLARAALKQADSLIFNPRFIINDVLRRVLLPAWDALTANRFPPPGIEPKRPSADVAQWLTSISGSSDVKRRYACTAVVWGNDPQDRPGLAAIPGEVFEAFGLDRPDFGTYEPKALKGATPLTPPPSADLRMEKVNEVTKTLENWVQSGDRLPQQTANSIRKNLAAILNEQIDWNAERLIKNPVQADQISIPNARGEDGLQTNPLQIASDSTDPDGRLRKELTSLIRLKDIYSDRTNYPEYGEDLARVGNLADRLIPQALKLVRARNIKQCQLALLALTANSRLLGLADRGRTAKAVNSLLFGEVPQLESIPEDLKSSTRDWRDLQQQAMRIRPRLTSVLIATCGCFQGTGDTPNGVDVTRLIDHYPGEDIRLEPAQLDQLTPEERQVLTSMGEARLGARLRALTAELDRIRGGVVAQLGKDFDKNLVARSIKEFADVLRAMGAWDIATIGISVGEFSKLCEEFRSCALKEALDQLENRVEQGESDAEGKSGFGRGRVSMAPLLLAERFLGYATGVVGAAERHVKTLEEQYRGIDPSSQADAILKFLESFQSQLVELERGGQNALT